MKKKINNNFMDHEMNLDDLDGKRVFNFNNLIGDKLVGKNNKFNSFPGWDNYYASDDGDGGGTGGFKFLNISNVLKNWVSPVSAILEKNDNYQRDKIKIISSYHNSDPTTQTLHISDLLLAMRFPTSVDTITVSENVDLSQFTSLENLTITTPDNWWEKRFNIVSFAKFPSNFKILSFEGACNLNKITIGNNVNLQVLNLVNPMNNLAVSVSNFDNNARVDILNRGSEEKLTLQLNLPIDSLNKNKLEQLHFFGIKLDNNFGKNYLSSDLGNLFSAYLSNCDLGDTIDLSGLNKNKIKQIHLGNNLALNFNFENIIGSNLNPIINIDLQKEEKEYKKIQIAVGNIPTAIEDKREFFSWIVNQISLNKQTIFDYNNQTAQEEGIKVKIDIKNDDGTYFVKANDDPFKIGLLVNKLDLK